MTQDDKDALKEFLEGAGMVVFTVGAFILFAMIIMGWSQEPPEQKFDVVDKYNGCDVVKYTPNHSANYSYFLDCKK